MTEPSDYYDSYWEQGVGGWHVQANLTSPLRDLLERVTRDRDVLDFGGGDGERYGHVLRTAARTVTVADVSPAVLRRRQEAGDEAILIDQLREVDDEFDIVLALEVLEHILDPAGALSTAIAPLRGGGQVLITVPNAFSLWNRARMAFGRLPASGVGPPGVAGRTYTAPHIRFFDFVSLLNLVSSVGLEPLSAWASSLDLWKFSPLIPEKLRPIPLNRQSPLFAHTFIVLARKPFHLHEE